jgi:hypothetical protein
VSVKLRVTVHGELANQYVLEIDDANGHGIVAVGPADARSLIEAGRRLFDEMERDLAVAGRIETADHARRASAADVEPGSVSE